MLKEKKFKFNRKCGKCGNTEVRYYGSAEIRNCGIAEVQKCRNMFLKFLLPCFADGFVHSKYAKHSQ